MSNTFATYLRVAGLLALAVAIVLACWPWSQH
jgi:hypothetical protein